MSVVARMEKFPPQIVALHAERLDYPQQVGAMRKSATVQPALLGGNAREVGQKLIFCLSVHPCVEATAPDGQPSSTSSPVA